MLSDGFVNRNTASLLAMYKIPVQAPCRRRDLADCSQIVLQQSVALDEALLATGLTRFFQPARNRGSAFSAPSRSNFRSTAGSMKPSLARGLTQTVAVPASFDKRPLAKSARYA